MPEDPHPVVKPGTVMDDSEPGLKNTVSAAAKLLCGVRDSVNAFVPLKSITGHLYVILGNCKVWPPTYSSSPQCLWSFQQTEVDEQSIELLAPRLKVLSGSLCAPIHPGDVNEKERGEKLER